MDKDFLLTNEVAKELFFDAANTMPIVDYHCHIDPKEIAEDRKFENITQVWLGGDHYKWESTFPLVSLGTTKIFWISWCFK